MLWSCPLSSDWIDINHATSFVDDWVSIANCERFLKDPDSTKATAPPFFLYCSVVNPHPPYLLRIIYMRYIHRHLHTNSTYQYRIYIIRSRYTSNATWEAYVDRDALATSLTRTKETYGIRQHPADVYSMRSEGVPEEWNETVAHNMALAYHGQIAEVDNMLGRVQAALDASGAAASTYVVFTSDHGEMHLEHKLVEKMSMYEPSARVPLIITGPGVPQGQIVRDFTTLIDLLPTFLDMAQVTELPDAGLQGYTLAPFLGLKSRRKDLAVRPAHVVVEYAGEEVNAPQFMLRHGHMKLIQYGKQPPFIDYPPQLFNVTAVKTYQQNRVGFQRACIDAKPMQMWMRMVLNPLASD